MNYYFDEFTDEESTRFEEFDFESNGEGGLHSYGLDIDVYKHDDKFYAERQEDEECFQEMDGRIYVLEPIWYMPIDLEKICADYANGTISEENFDIEGYELY